MAKSDITDIKRLSKTNRFFTRKLKRSDAEDIIWLCQNNDYPIAPDKTKNTLRDGRIIYYGRFDRESDTLIGFISLDGQKIGLIRNLLVDYRHREEGIAKKLIETAEKFFKEHGAEQSTLHVREDNSKARSLYKRLGYEEAEYLEGYYNDGKIGGYFMTKKL